MASDASDNDMQEDVLRLQNVLGDDFYDDSDDNYFDEEEEEDESGVAVTTHQDEQSEFSHVSSAGRSQEPSFSLSLPSEIGSVAEEAPSEPSLFVAEQLAGHGSLQVDPDAPRSVEGALLLNRSYQELLLAHLERLSLALEENRSKQTELTSRIEDRAHRRRFLAQANRRRAGTLWGYGVPYFKNLGDLSTPPANADVRNKKLTNLPKYTGFPRHRWYHRDRQLLMEAVQQDSRKRLLMPLLSRRELEEEKLQQIGTCSAKELQDKLQAADVELKRMRTKRERDTKRRKARPKSKLNFDYDSDEDGLKSESQEDMSEDPDSLETERDLTEERERLQEQLDAVLPIQSRIDKLDEEIEEKKKTPAKDLLLLGDPDKVDWLKIAKVDFGGRREWDALERIWRNVLHPSVNRSQWQEEEQARLMEIVEKHNHLHWDRIAQELGTNRTPFQCLQHYQSSLNPKIIKHTWTAAETNWLMLLVPQCRQTNNKISWNKVAYYISGHSAVQCQYRWKQINPTLKRGKWTVEEDTRLLAAVQILGTGDWQKLAEFVPDRDSNQCRERYVNCLDPSISLEHWTYDEDKILWELVESNGRGNWSRICQYLPGRTDNNCLQRYNRLLTWKRQMDWFNSLPSNLRMEMTSEDLLKRTKPQGGPSGIFKDDYIRQEEDRAAGNLVVPRPPPVVAYRAYYVGTGLRLMRQRALLLQAVEAQVVKLRRSGQAVLGSQEVVDEVARLTLDAIPLKCQQRTALHRTLITNNPCHMKVSQLLSISRALSQGKGLPRKQKTAARDKLTRRNVQLRQLLYHKMCLHRIKRGRPRKFFWTRSRQQVMPGDDEMEMASRTAFLAALHGLGVDVHSVLNTAKARHQLPALALSMNEVSEPEEPVLMPMTDSRECELTKTKDDEGSRKKRLSAKRQRVKTKTPARRSARKRPCPSEEEGADPPMKKSRSEEEGEECYEALLQIEALEERRERHRATVSATQGQALRGSSQVATEPQSQAASSASLQRNCPHLDTSAVFSSNGAALAEPVPGPHGDAPALQMVSGPRNSMGEPSGVWNSTTSEFRHSSAEQMQASRGDGAISETASGVWSICEEVPGISSCVDVNSTDVTGTWCGRESQVRGTSSTDAADCVSSHTIPSTLSSCSLDDTATPQVMQGNRSHALVDPVAGDGDKEGEVPDNFLLRDDSFPIQLTEHTESFSLVDQDVVERLHGVVIIKGTALQCGGPSEKGDGAEDPVQAPGEMTSLLSENILENIKRRAENGNSRSQGNADAAQPKTRQGKLPYFPPNVTNIRAFKTFLLQRNSLLRASKDNSNAKQTASAPQRLENFSGRNSTVDLEEVPGTSGSGAQAPSASTDRGTSMTEDAACSKTNRQTQSSASQSLRVPSLDPIRASPEYQKLQSRFLSLFMWPAFISTVEPPFIRHEFSTRAKQMQEIRKANKRRLHCNEGNDEDPEEGGDDASLYTRKKTPKKAVYPCVRGPKFYKIARKSLEKKKQHYERFRKSRFKDTNNSSAAGVAENGNVSSAPSSRDELPSPVGVETPVEDPVAGTSNDAPSQAASQPACEEPSSVQASEASAERQEESSPPQKRGRGRPFGAKGKPKNRVKMRASSRLADKPSNQAEPDEVPAPKVRVRAYRSAASRALNSALRTSLQSIREGREPVLQVLPCPSQPAPVDQATTSQSEQQVTMNLHPSQPTPVDQATTSQSEQQVMMNLHPSQPTLVDQATTSQSEQQMMMYLHPSQRTPVDQATTSQSEQQMMMHLHPDDVNSQMENAMPTILSPIPEEERMKICAIVPVNKSPGLTSRKQQKKLPNDIQWRVI